MIKTLKATIKNLYYWIKQKLIRFKKWIILIIFGAVILAAPPQLPDIALENIQADYHASNIQNRYRLEKTAFILDTVDENAIQAEVGNKTLDKFTPELTLRKWDDEVNFKVKYKHAEKEKDQKVDIENEKIKWKGNKTEVHYYDIKKGELLHDEVLEHDVYEVEVILLEKPDTNIVSFDIETKGLNFYYQPELTQEEIDEGAERPENVVGSYAVYHESKQGDYHKMGGKNYMAGKAFHIYRPKIIDSAGTEVWGELNITDNLLTVTIPQEFLDNAVYPVRHAAGLTFGYESEGGSGLAIAGRSFDYAYRRGSVESFSGSGTLDKITVNLYTSTTTNTVDVSVLINTEDSEGSGSHGQVVKVEILGGLYTSTNTWYDFTANSENLSANDYVLNAVGDGNDITSGDSYEYLRLAFDDTGSSNYYWSNAGSYSSLSNESPWTETVDGTGKRYSFYCTYTEEGAEARRMFLTQ